MLITFFTQSSNQNVFQLLYIIITKSEIVSIFSLLFKIIYKTGNEISQRFFNRI